MRERHRSTLPQMAERLRCEVCGATNVAGAEWCGQCYTSLGDPVETNASADAEVEPSDTTPPDATPPDTSVAVGQWTCSVCGESASLELETCPVCGGSIFDAFAGAPKYPAPSDVAVASLVPGLGLAQVGRGGEGVIVAILVGFCVLGGLAIAAVGEGLGWLLVFIGVAIWALAGRDAYTVAAGRAAESWIRPRALTVIAVVVLIVLAVVLLRALPGTVTR